MKRSTEQLAAAVAAHEARAGSISMRQLRLTLLAEGLLANVETAMAAAGTAAQIEWGFSDRVERDYPLVKSMASLLGLSDAQVDALFGEARKL